MVEPGHLDPHEAEDESEAVFEVVELGRHPLQQEIEGAETQDCEDVGGENQERLLRDRKDRGDTIDGEDDVGELDHHQRQQQRCASPASRVTDKELPVAKGMRDRQEALQQADDDIFLRIRM